MAAFLLHPHCSDFNSYNTKQLCEMWKKKENKKSDYFHNGGQTCGLPEQAIFCGSQA
jgi:hypothetical protein